MTSDHETPASGAAPDVPVEPTAQTVAPDPGAAPVVAAPEAAPVVAAAAPTPRRALFVSWVIGLLVVALAAVLLGGLAAALAGLLASGGWGTLVAVLAGFMVAAGAAGAGWLVLVLLTVQRRVAAGRRLRVAAISIGAVAVTLAVGYALGQVSRLGSGASGLVVGAVAIVAALVPPELVGREERRAAALPTVGGGEG